MKKPSGIYSFIIFYSMLLLLAYAIFERGFDSVFEQSGGLSPWLYTLSKVNLTQLKVNLLADGSYAFLFSSLLITQISGLMLLSVLLWLLWQLLGPDSQREYSLKKAFALSLLATLISETAIFLFFMYGIPTELTHQFVGSKTIAALSLSVHAFNNSGASYISNLLLQDTLQTNFIIQIGIIGGTILGNLGIFVLIELFSPMMLRRRLADTTIDWSAITKIAIFGTAAGLASYAALYFLMAEESTFYGKNLLETLSYILMEAVGSRGFGSIFTLERDTGITLLTLVYSTFSAAPFGIGGGVGLLFFIYLVALLRGKFRSIPFLETAFSIVKNWILLSFCVLSFCIIAGILSKSSLSSIDMMLIYNSNCLPDPGIKYSNIDLWLITMLSTIGRLSFILASAITLKEKKRASHTY